MLQTRQISPTEPGGCSHKHNQLQLEFITTLHHGSGRNVDSSASTKPQWQPSQDAYMAYAHTNNILRRILVPEMHLTANSAQDLISAIIGPVRLERDSLISFHELVPELYKNIDCKYLFVYLLN